MKEMNVIGTMQLLAACQKSASVRRLVVKSSTAVYGSSSRDPALFTEEMEPRSLPRSGYAKDAVEVEGYVRGFARRRPDVSVGVLRFTDVIGPGADSLLLRYLRLPVVPTVLGFDPRVQLLHADDALEVLRLATMSGRPGTVNVGGAGVLLLSQMVRRAGRVPVPVPAPVVHARRPGRAPGRAARLLPRSSCASSSSAGWSTRPGCATEFGYTPRYDTVAGVRRRGQAPAGWRCGCSRPRCAGPRAPSSTRSGRPPRPARRDRAVGDARVIPLHGDGSGDRADPSRRPRPVPASDPGPERRPTGLGAPDRRRPGLPAPPDHRRLRGRRVRLRPRPHRARAGAAVPPAVREVVPGGGDRPAATSRPPAARWSSPTTPARCRWTR